MQLQCFFLTLITYDLDLDLWPLTFDSVLTGIIPVNCGLLRFLFVFVLWTCFRERWRQTVRDKRRTACTAGSVSWQSKRWLATKDQHTRGLPPFTVSFGSNHWRWGLRGSKPLRYLIRGLQQGAYSCQEPPPPDSLAETCLLCVWYATCGQALQIYQGNRTPRTGGKRGSPKKEIGGTAWKGEAERGGDEATKREKCVETDLPPRILEYCYAPNRVNGASTNKPKVPSGERRKERLIHKNC